MLLTLKRCGGLFNGETLHPEKGGGAVAVNGGGLLNAHRLISVSALIALCKKFVFFDRPVFEVQ